MNKLIRSAFVIGRRDFTATVMSRAFLLFLLGPLFPVAMGVLFGTVGAHVSDTAEKPHVAVVATKADFADIENAQKQLSEALPQTPFVRLTNVAPAADADAQRQNLLMSKSPSYLGVLEGGLGRPRYTGALQPDGATVDQLRLVIDAARRARTDSGPAEPALEAHLLQRSTGALASNRALTAQAGQMVLFLLTILLAGMLLSQLIEEKSNKVIEVLAAAVPIDSIFLGKLLAMLAMSLVGIAVWTAAGVAGIVLVTGHGLSAITAPAIGWPAFLALTIVYFAMSYLLLGSVFLGIGAQASTVREVQTLSMPVTMAQVLIFGLAATVVGNSGSPIAIGAAIFPLSSPYAMIARAAEQPELWPHLVAIVWQLLWVAIILRLASGLFRRSVLQSGPRVRWWRRRGAAKA